MNSLAVSARYIENSPTFYLDKVNTPLLIVQGSSDGSFHRFLETSCSSNCAGLAKRFNMQNTRAKLIGPAIGGPTSAKFVQSVAFMV